MIQAALAIERREYVRWRVEDHVHEQIELLNDDIYAARGEVDCPRLMRCPCHECARRKRAPRSTDPIVFGRLELVNLTNGEPAR